MAGSMVVTFAAVGGASASLRHHANAKAGATLDVPIVQSFSGPSAAFGFTNQGGAQAAIDLINSDGGVLGHQFKTVAVDDLGDPADAAVDVTRALAQYGSNIAFFTGSGTVEGTSITSLITSAKQVIFSGSGATQFDTYTNPYFYRIVSPDPIQGAAMAYEAKALHLKRIALVFGNTADAQTETPGILAAAKSFHLHVVNNTAVVVDQTGYQAEVQKMIAAKPQAVLFELDPPTSAAFWGEYKTLNHGNLPMMIGDPVAYEAGWLSTMEKILGVSALRKHVYIVGPYAASSGPAYRIWVQAVNALPSEFNQYKTTIIPNGNKQADYDTVNIAALAMLEAHSTTPSVFNKYITKVVAKGGTVVHSFAQGKAALAHHKTITYVGATGQVVFNRYHNSPGGFVVNRWSPSTTPPTGGKTIPKEMIAKVVIR